MRLFPIRTRLVKAGDDLVELVLESMAAQHLQLEDNDVLVLTSKIVSYSEGRVVELSEVEPSAKAKDMAVKYSLMPEFAELILREADEIYGGVEKAVLTLKNGVMAPNAGIDNKNAPCGQAVLWPSRPEQTVKEIRDRIRLRTGKTIAVLMVDSGLVPLRIGTVGLALAVAGFKPIKDDRGDKDLFGKTIVMTRQAVADGLASAAQVLMGEAAERIPFVVIRDAPLDFVDDVYGPSDLMMPFNECIFMSTFVDGSSLKGKTSQGNKN